MDTAAKRHSAIGVLLPFLRLPPLPDGTVSQADRQTLVGLYGGVLAASAVIIADDYPRRLVSLDHSPWAALDHSPRAGLNHSPWATLEAE